MRTSILPLLLLTVGSATAYQVTKAEWSTYRCPPNPSTTLPSPTYHNQTPIFTTCSEQIINAPIDKVYHAILNFQTYPQWNTFVRNVTLLSGPPSTSLANPLLNTQVLFTTYGLAPWNISTTSREIISHLHPASGDGFAFLAWRYNDQVDGLFVRAEHPNVLTEVDGEGTRYVSWESYYGGGSYVVSGLLEGNLRRQFARQGVDLKGYVESLPS